MVRFRRAELDTDQSHVSLTGTLKIAGAKESLEGAGSVTIRNGAIMGEPIVGWNVVAQQTGGWSRYNAFWENARKNILERPRG